MTIVAFVIFVILNGLFVFDCVLIELYSWNCHGWDCNNEGGIQIRDGSSTQ